MGSIEVTELRLMLDRSDTTTPARSTRRALLLLLAVAALFALAICLHEPITVPMPEYLTDAQQWSPSTPMTDTFTPLAYPLFLTPALHAVPHAGPRMQGALVLALQAALYLATAITAFFLLRLLDASPRLAAMGCVPILLYPDFFQSIAKIWDVGLSAFLFLLLVLACLDLQRRGPAPARSILLGVAFAAGLFCRPNFALLAPAMVYAVWSARPRPAFFSIFSMFGISAVVTILGYALLGAAAHGRPFLPANGPYNLYVGNNPFAGQAMLHKLNGEPSLYPAMRAQHPDLTPLDAGPEFFHAAGLQPLYTHDATVFLLHHPAEDLRLVAIKLLTFFRPDTKVHALNTRPGLVKAILALPAVLFLAALLPFGRAALTPVDRLLLAIDAAYLLPFLLTNSDPRFRAPLDALFLLHTMRLLCLRFPGIDSSFASPTRPR